MGLINFGVVFGVFTIRSAIQGVYIVMTVFRLSKMSSEPILKSHSHQIGMDTVKPV